LVLIPISSFGGFTRHESARPGSITPNTSHDHSIENPGVVNCTPEQQSAQGTYRLQSMNESSIHSSGHFETAATVSAGDQVAKELSHERTARRPEDHHAFAARVDQ